MPAKPKPGSGSTIDDFIAQSGAGASSLRQYRAELTRMQARLNMRLCDATPGDITRLKEQLRDTKAGPGRCVLLRMFYAQAERPHLVKLLKLRQPQRRLNPDSILSVADVNAIIKGARTLRDRSLVLGSRA